MNYKKEIIEMIEKITNRKYIYAIWSCQNDGWIRRPKRKKQGKAEWTITLITKRKLKNF